MFGFNDFWKFFLAFFLIYPVVTIIHLSGHLFFVAIFGGTEKKVVIGHGKKLFSFWKFEIRQYYFWAGGCEFKKIKFNSRVSDTFIFLGGAIFNAVSIGVVNILIYIRVLEPSVWWYQFVYFSFIALFWSIFPMYYPSGTPSDGKAVLLLWKDEFKDKSSDDLFWRKDEEKNNP
ncbi:hypothetical protein [Peribacillus glennii]|uniref:DUF3267 domain-containing protein n=1 Tax=Peribacillus glennii TaxID=2303991 RepID=A0A372LJY7_9BACI|nr:hypothetical protein [Peribacillus glennii]RFU66757.1 hypothetical protein D0466_00335 [Peribacillus glennii]